VGGVVVQGQFQAENEDKAPSDVKSEVTEAIAELKKAIEGNDIGTIKATRSS
jgi:molecular chaperone DnaK